MKQIKPTPELSSITKSVLRVIFKNIENEKLMRNLYNIIRGCKIFKYFLLLINSLY